MTVLQGGRWRDAARRLFNLKELIPQSFSDELVGTVSIIPPRPEDCYLVQDKLYHGIGNGSAGSGSFAHVNLRNESPDCLVIVEQAWAFTDAAEANVVVRLGNNPVGTGPQTVGGRDTRLGIVATGKSQAGQIKYGHELAITGTFVQRLVAPEHTMAFVGCPVVLAPGDALFLWNSVENDVLRVTFLWRERLAEPGELF